MKEIKLASFTTTVQDGRHYVAADEVTNMLRAIAELYRTRQGQDATVDGAQTLGILHKELVYLADTLDVHFITETGEQADG
ncbi:hypothetical protein ABZ802_31230 [Streptomyces sp. NPDC047737]|uniref:hypothetical protein n=1 Tax=Streptomyces sp. NPDC047737 TaxID=3155740 RepID=UPI0033EB88B2